LKANHTPPTELGTGVSHFKGRQAKMLEVKMKGHMDSLNPTSDIMTTGLVEKVIYSRMCHIYGAINRLGLPFFIDGPDLFNMHHSQHETFRIP
jgi:hypothetical protein